MNLKHKILLTGATGFIGRAFHAAAVSRGLCVRAVVRNDNIKLKHASEVVVCCFDAKTDWSSALIDCDVVVHLAARVHVMSDKEVDPLSAFRALNVHATLNLARQAALAGVKRFIFISSIKVNGESTQIGCPYTCYDAPAPEDDYGVSKAEAEAALQLLAQETGMEVVIIRPPLVYGPGVMGNFSTMVRWVQCGLPLPLGSTVENRRSLVAVDNLIDLMLTCVDHPDAAGEIFLVSDGEDLSTTDLLRKLSIALGKPVRLLSVPPILLQAAGLVLGRKGVSQRLLASLQVDISHTCKVLNWKPAVTVDEGLRSVVKGMGK